MALPGLTKLGFCASELSGPKGVTLSQECLQVLPQGQHLELIDLRGVLTDTCVSKLCHAFHSRQAQNEAPPLNLERLLLPSISLGTAQPMMQYINEACAERLCHLDGNLNCYKSSSHVLQYFDHNTQDSCCWHHSMMKAKVIC